MAKSPSVDRGSRAVPRPSIGADYPAASAGSRYHCGWTSPNRHNPPVPSGSDIDTALRNELLAAHEELLRRDEAFRAWDEETARLRDERERFRQLYESARSQVDELQAGLDGIRATRAWRLAERWRTLRGRLPRRGI